jgi:enoyl-CoA hydratase
MWVFRLGIEKAKRLLLTGDTIDGKEAYRIGLISHCVPESSLDEVSKEEKRGRDGKMKKEEENKEKGE